MALARVSSRAWPRDVRCVLARLAPWSMPPVLLRSDLGGEIFARRGVRAVVATVPLRVCRARDSRGHQRAGSACEVHARPSTSRYGEAIPSPFLRAARVWRHEPRKI